MSSVQLLENRTWGRDASAQTMFVIAGWPDTAEVYESNVVDRFQDRYRIVGMNLPGYSAESRRTMPTFGWSFDQVVDMFQATLQQAMASDRSGLLPVIVAHDWGCPIVSEFLLRSPRYFSRIVLLDIATQVSGDVPWSATRFLLGKEFGAPIGKAIVIAWYQLYLAAAFLLGLWWVTRPIGDAMTRGFARLARAPQYRRNPNIRSESRRTYDGVHSGMNYLYFRLWVNVLVFRKGLASNKFFHEPVVPVLYLYGEQKPVQFHTSTWLKALQHRTDGSKAISFPAQHWFYAEPGSETSAQALDSIDQFLSGN